jgi:hypothetical protein
MKSLADTTAAAAAAAAAAACVYETMKYSCYATVHTSSATLYTCI